MSNKQPMNSEHTSWDSIMRTLAGYIINDLQEVQSSGELAGLLQHKDPEIRQEAVRIFNDLRQLIGHLGKV